MSHYYNEAGDLVPAWTPGAYPSPSTILGRLRSREYEALVERVGQEEADKLMETAAARGTRVHKACELYAKGAEPVVAAKESGLLIEELTYLEGFVAWREEYVKRFVAIERVVGSEKYKFRGRLDILAEMLDGTFWVVDIKTGMDNVRHGLQLKFYWQGVLETLKLRCRMGVLALDAKRKAGYRNSKSAYGLKEFKEPLWAMVAHVQMDKWWTKKQPIKEPTVRNVPVWAPEDMQ